MAGSALIIGSALRNRAGPELAVTAGDANFTGTLFLAYLPVSFTDKAHAPGTPPGAVAQPIRRSPG